MPNHRRSFLTSASLGLAAATWPTWLADAFGASSSGGGVPRGCGPALPTAIGERPLLWILRPPVDNDDTYDSDAWAERWARAQRWGALLNHGADADLAAFAVCEVCVGHADDFGVDWDTWMVLESDGIHPVAFEPTPPEDLVGYDEMPGWAVDDALIEADLVRLGEAVHDLVFGDPVLLARWAKQQPRAAQALQVLAGERSWAGLAAMARDEVVGERIPGSAWGVATGCGSYIEGEERDSYGFLCGIGSVPDKARRYLVFREE